MSAVFVIFIGTTLSIKLESVVLKSFQIINLISLFCQQEMTAAFDSELRRREHEFKLKTDEMCAVVLSHELKVRRVREREILL